MGEREERKASIVCGNIMQLQENGCTEEESEMKLSCECILPWCYPNMVPSSQREGCCAFYWKLWQIHGALPEKKNWNLKKKLMMMDVSKKIFKLWEEEKGGSESKIIYMQ